MLDAFKRTIRRGPPLFFEGFRRRGRQFNESFTEIKQLRKRVPKPPGSDRQFRFFESNYLLSQQHSSET